MVEFDQAQLDFPGGFRSSDDGYELFLFGAFVLADDPQRLDDSLKLYGALLEVRPNDGRTQDGRNDTLERKQKAATIPVRR